MSACVCMEYRTQNRTQQPTHIPMFAFCKFISGCGALDRRTLPEFASGFLLGQHDSALFRV
eukprot:1900333-Rhodomonas_salina.1